MRRSPPEDPRSSGITAPWKQSPYGTGNEGRPVEYKPGQDPGNDKLRKSNDKLKSHNGRG